MTVPKIRVYYKAMNRGAQGIVNAWLVMNPKATLDDLRKAFPNRVNPSMPPKLKESFRDPETAKQLREDVGFGYIDKTNDIMKLQDGSQVVIVSMWSADSFEIIKEHAAQYDIEVAEGYDKAKDTEGKGWYHEYLNGYVPPKPEPVSEIRTDAQGSTPANTQKTQSAGDKLDDIIIEEDENGYRIDTRGAVDRDDYDGVWERLEAEVPLSTPDHMVVNIAFRQLGEDAADTIERQAEEWYTFFLVENVYKGDATPPDNAPTRKLYYIHLDDSWSNSRNMDELLSHLEGKSYQDRDEDDIIGVRVYQGEIIRPRNMPHGGWYPDEAIFHHDYIWSALQQEGKTGFFGNNKACLRQDPPRFFKYVQGSGTPGEVNFYINGKLVDTVTVDKDYCTQPLPPQRFRHFPLNPDVWEASMKKNEPDEENQVNISIRTISLDQLADAARAYWKRERGDFERGVFATIETNDDDAQPPCCIFNDPVNTVLNDGIRLALTYLPDDDNNLTIRLGFIDAKGHDPDSILAALLAYRRFRDGKLFLFSWVKESSIDMLDYDGLTVNIFNYDNPESDTPTLTDTIYVEVDGDYWDIVV